MKRQIMWVSQHLEIDTMNGKVKEQAEPVYKEKYDEEDDEIQNVMSTPFGLWRIDDSFNPYKQFKLWMAHTNFTINRKVASTIKSIPGVEILSVLTRYRFMIGVAELFTVQEVRVAIEKTLGCGSEKQLLIADGELKNKVLELKAKLAKDGDYAILVFPNGQIEHTTMKEGSKAFSEKLLLYKNSVDHSSSILIESSDGD